jgi:single-stranded-DNA-specific exonuclease
MVRWIDPPPLEVPENLHRAVGGNPLIATVLARRGIVSAEAAQAFLDPGAYAPASPNDLPDLVFAAQRLREAIGREEQIAVWGDFDADGQTATALLLQTLQTLGAAVVFHVPDRQEGHGLHRRHLEQLIAGGARLILTCDTGVSAHAAVVHARSLGAEVIITDHHVPSGSAQGQPAEQPVAAQGGLFPPALAVINPHRLPAGHPFATLTGVGVAYQLAKALDSDVADRCLDLVALGTVADVATLTGDTRYLVQRGLEALRRTERLGLQAMAQVADLRLEGCTEEHIGFALGPRLNALGRLADATRGVQLLTTDDWTLAQALASEAEGLNSRRQWLTKQVTDAALAQVERDPSLVADYQALVLSHPAWPSGVIGIVAGRLAERFGKPAVLIATPVGKLGRGSGRSVPGLDLIAALEDCASLFESYGGHPGAAGFSIEPERIGELRTALSRAVAARAATIPEQTLPIDAYVDLPDLTIDLVSQIDRLAPFGPGNPPLTLAARDLHVLSEATIGRTGEHRRVTVEDVHDHTQTVFWWQGAGQPLPRGRFDLAFSVRASDYRGVPEVQIGWMDARSLEPATTQILPTRTIAVDDRRTETDPEAMLRELIGRFGPALQVWAEGGDPLDVEVRNRLQVAPGARLALWTLPPGPRVLREILALVQPQEIILFAFDPGLDGPNLFLRRLAGLVNYSLRAKAGEFELQAAAAATAQRVATVEAGLECLAAQGKVLVEEREGDRWQLSTGPGPADEQRAKVARARLEAYLAETAAYRAYFRDAPLSALQGALSWGSTT